MTGKARLKAELCSVSEYDDYEDFKDKCTLTLNNMLEEDPSERTEAHIGSETQKTNTSTCYLNSKSGR